VGDAAAKHKHSDALLQEIQILNITFYRISEIIKDELKIVERK
jgi:hypothetical protein